ncbi:MAG: peptide deformylase [Candidatus Omnitrophota bacterium]
MEDLKIYIYPEPVLRKKSKPVKKFTTQVRELLDKMLELMYESKGVGLAAPQVGEDLCLIVVDAGNGPLKLCNPVILKRQGATFMEEGCLSLPEIIINLRRAKKIRVSAINEEGKDIVFDAEDVLARVIQHEIDHLDGRLLIDYLPWHKRWLAKRKLKRVTRNQSTETRV